MTPKTSDINLILKKIDQLTSKQLNQFFIGAVLSIVLIGTLDALFGNQLSLQILYVIPIILAALLLSKKQTIALIIILSALSNIIVASSYIMSVKTNELMLWRFTFQAILISLHLLIWVVLAYLIVAFKRSNLLLESMAIKDPLTGIANRKRFDESLAHEVIRSKRYGHILTLAYIDLDHFKQLNDNFGHAFGDQVLITIATAMHDLCRSTDTVARLGGDEFAIILPETNPASARIVLGRLLDFVRHFCITHQWPVSISMGVVSFVKSIETPIDAVKMADRAMYFAKERGRNQAHFLIFNEMNATELLSTEIKRS
jgi:diguanylate cyclase (GGDEF)-like protein